MLPSDVNRCHGFTARERLTYSLRQPTDPQRHRRAVAFARGYVTSTRPVSRMNPPFAGVTAV
jgi:hypothetical protein